MQDEQEKQQDTTKPADDEAETEANPSFDADQTVVMTETDFADNAGDGTAEINVDELVAKVDAENTEDVHHKQEVRRRLEQIAESQSFEDTYAVEFEKKG